MANRRALRSGAGRAVTRPSPADACLILVLAVTIGSLYGRYWSPAAGPPTHAIVRAEKAPALRVPLHVDARFTVAGRLGNSELEVRDGRIRFVTSPCRRKVCLRSGWMHAAHDATACLPNRITLSLDSPQRQFDGISQ
jgi:hypothetical protein